MKREGEVRRGRGWGRGAGHVSGQQGRECEGFASLRRAACCLRASLGIVTKLQAVMESFFGSVIDVYSKTVFLFFNDEV